MLAEHLQAKLENSAGSVTSRQARPAGLGPADIDPFQILVSHP
jgi:hypothetical protein